MAFQSVDSAEVGNFFGTPWSNKSDAQPPEGDYMKFVLICLNFNWEPILIENLFCLMCPKSNFDRCALHLDFNLTGALLYDLHS